MIDAMVFVMAHLPLLPMSHQQALGMSYVLYAYLKRNTRITRAERDYEMSTSLTAPAAPTPPTEVKVEKNLKKTK